eukprot:gene33366-41176_t
MACRFHSPMPSIPHRTQNRTKLNTSNKHNINLKTASKLNVTEFDNYKLTSQDNNYVIYTNNNSHYKYNELYTDKDILVSFEDDAESAILDLNTTVIEELAGMGVDLLFL